MELIQSHIQSANKDSNSQIETPIKKYKKPESHDLNTADSIVLTDQKPSSLNDIDAQ
jgi:hypothetical protein